MTREVYLEITYRHGKALAGYLNLPGAGDFKVVRSQKAAAGLVVDYGPGDKPVGIEITSPSSVTLEALNNVLAKLHQEELGAEELAPLLAG